MNYILKKLFFLIALTVTLIIIGQTRLQPPPDKIANDLRTFTKQFRLDNIGKSSGVLVKIYYPEKWEWVFADGMKDIDSQTPATPNLIFRAASISKLFCSAITLKLVEQEIINLNDPINKWLNKNYVEQLPNGNKITIKDLLQHTSGLFEPQAELSQKNSFLANPYKDYSDEILSIISGLKLKALGYGNYFYSNANFNLLSEIISRATNMSYKDCVNSIIIKPLRLKDTYLNFLPKSSIFNGYIPSIYLPKVVRPSKDSLINFTKANVSWGQGAADISSTTTDLIKFYFSLQNNKIISKNWVELMTKDAIKYGLGTKIFKRNGKPYAIGHTGDGFGHSNILCKLNFNNIYICFSFNRYGINSKTMEKYLNGLTTIIKNNE
jgi:D-alanyl-D-alanine carboxypeptidase